MASYFITGVSRGLGYEFLKQLSSNPANTIIGFVRDKASTESKIAADIKRANIHIIQGDITDYDSMKKAMNETAAITGGRLDYLIANAATLPSFSAFDPLGILGKDPIQLQSSLIDCFTTNVVGNIHLINIFMSLILKGDQKKVITLSSGLADIEITRQYDLGSSAAYSISKAAMNSAVAKFSAEYAQDGVLFLSVCPGMVNTGAQKIETEEDQRKVMEMIMKFQKYAPHFEGPSQPEAAVKDVISVFEKANVANGDGGAFISHLGTKQWL